MKQKTKKNRGGSVKTKGGFGCLFMPSLKCKNSTEIENNNGKE